VEIHISRSVRRRNTGAWQARRHGISSRREYRVVPLVSKQIGRRGKTGESPARTHRCNPGPLPFIRRGTFRPRRHCAAPAREGSRRGGEARRPASRNVWWRRQILQALIVGVWGIF